MFRPLRVSGTRARMEENRAWWITPRSYSSRLFTLSEAAYPLSGVAAVRGGMLLREGKKSFISGRARARALSPRLAPPRGFVFFFSSLVIVPFFVFFPEFALIQSQGQRSRGSGGRSHLPCFFFFFPSGRRCCCCLCFSALTFRLSPLPPPPNFAPLSALFHYWPRLGTGRAELIVGFQVWPGGAPACPMVVPLFSNASKQAGADFHYLFYCCCCFCRRLAGLAKE